MRQLLGYDRLDQEWDVEQINEIYINYWLPLWNFFTPVMKLKSKTRIGGRIVKEYDEPQTPFERLLNSGHLSEDQKLAMVQYGGGRNEPVHPKTPVDSKWNDWQKVSLSRRSGLWDGESANPNRKLD